jgi:hypothetical protein
MVGSPFNDAFHVPAGLRTDAFLLRPIRETDAECDHEAVMESREFLRLWEQSTWPEDDFTVEANREDLAKLERRHADGESFTYTVMNLDETACLGCVYIFPIGARLFSKAQIAAVDGPEWAAYDAAVYFWVRASRLADGLDRQLVEALGPWLAQDWRIVHPLIITNEQFVQQVEMIESAGLQLRFQLTYPNEPGKSLAYAFPSR